MIAKKQTVFSSFYNDLKLNQPHVSMRQAPTMACICMVRLSLTGFDSVQSRFKTAIEQW